MKRVLLVLALAALAATSVAFAEDPPTKVWDVTYDSGNDDIAWDIAVDALGSVYVTGNVNNGTDLDWHIIKYDANGDTLWTKTWDSGNGEDQAVSIAVVNDNARDVYVAGWYNNGTDDDIRLAKYDTDGNFIWERTYDSGGDDWGYSVTTDDAGNAYLAGREGMAIESDDLYCVKYSPEGSKVWEKQYDLNYAESAAGIAVDAAGLVYLHGCVFTGEPGDGFDLLTLKCDEAGDTIWSKPFDTGKPDYTTYNTIAVDNAGNIYVCGWLENASTPSIVDWFVICYDENGNNQWTKTVDHDYSAGAQGIAVDSEGFIYVTGPFGNETEFPDCRTHKLDPDGNVMWETIYEAGRSHGVAVDDAGFVYVTGHVGNAPAEDYLTIKYEQHVGVAEQPTPSSLTLEVADNLSSIPTIRYSIPEGQHGTLIFYSADGRKLESYTLDPAQTSFSWGSQSTPSGVYFAMLEADGQTAQAKIIITR